VHRFVNDLERRVGTYLVRAADVRGDGLLGDRQHPGDQRPVSRDYAEVWQSADKVVYSRTLEGVSSARTRIERDSTPRRSAGS
jgi:hypothetical protein